MRANGALIGDFWLAGNSFPFWDVIKDSEGFANAMFGAEAWLYALGALFIVVTLALPKGIVGALLERFGTQTTRLKGATPTDAPATKAAE